MASPDLTAGAVMDLAAARLNDIFKTEYTYTIQMPFLNLALLELQEIYEANNVPVTDQTSAIIEVDASASGIVEIGYAPDPPIADTPYLPDDLIEIKVAWQSGRDLNQWTRFSPVDYLPQWNLTAQIGQFTAYQWATNKMKLIAANADNDIKLDYIRSLFITVEDADDELNIINGKVFLANRTASLIAHDIEENEKHAADLLVDARNGLDTSLTITTKGRQKIQTRRMPFRAGWKSRNSGF